MRYNRTDLPAHAFSTSAASYWAIGQGHGRGHHQVIMLAGESGSGKTFTASLLIEHLVEAAQMSRSVYSGPTQERWEVSGDLTADGKYTRDRTERSRRLLACRRTILESFGNARTVREGGQTCTGWSGRCRDVPRMLFWPEPLARFLG